MHSFFSDKSLSELITISSLPDDKKQQYIELLPKLDEKGRAYLLDMLADYGIVEEARKESNEAINDFKEFAKDQDYDKLQGKLNKND